MLWERFMGQKIKQDISIGENIRKLRKKKKLTQEQMTAKLQLRNSNITRSIYSQIECGTYSIRVSELLAIADILECDINTLFNIKNG